MRGFRGSRSAQNSISSRFGKDQRDFSKDQQSQADQQKPDFSNLRILPNWVKTPETKAKEELEAQSPQQPAVELTPVSPIRNVASPKKAPEKAPAKKVAAAPKRKVAAKTKTAAPKAKSKAKAAPSKKAAVRRKAA